ncbi:hypothetical protein ACJCW6_004247, partial [Salmonella enterica]
CIISMTGLQYDYTIQHEVKEMNTEKAIDYAFEHGCNTGVDYRTVKGCLQGVLVFSVWGNGGSIKITQTDKGSRKWKVGGVVVNGRANAILKAVELLTGNIK